MNECLGATPGLLVNALDAPDDRPARIEVDGTRRDQRR
jgi:hypothetical protein